VTPSTVANRREEEAAIRKVEADLVATWNHHDARALPICVPRMAMW
jgi:hypothetical protein